MTEPKLRKCEGIVKMNQHLATGPNASIYWEQDGALAHSDTSVVGLSWTQVHLVSFSCSFFLTYLTCVTLFNSAVKPCVVLPQTQRQLAQNHLIKVCVRKLPQNRSVLLLPQSRMYFDRLCCASNYIVKRFCDVSARGRLLRRSRILPGPVFGKTAG